MISDKNREINIGNGLNEKGLVYLLDKSFG